MRQRTLRLLSASAVALLAIASALPAVAQAPTPTAPGEGQPGHEKPGHEKKAPPRGAVRPNRPAPHIPPAAAGQLNRPGGRALPGVAAGHLPPRNPVRPPGVAAPHARAQGFAAFRGRQVNVLPQRERRVWREGGWRREWHNGRFGWWWVVDGGWYFYPRPVYPYPTYISEVVYAAPYYGQFWYYCPYPPGYYPYVPYCTAPWQPVPATPY